MRLIVWFNGFAMLNPTVCQNAYKNIQDSEKWRGPPVFTQPIWAFEKCWASFDTHCFSIIFASDLDKVLDDM